MVQKSCTIAVVCPMYNSSAFLRETLDTVAAQTRLPDELILSDDGSTDETLLEAEKFIKDNPAINTILVKNEHVGRAGAMRNQGIRASQSDWIAFLDSDDHWYPKKLEAVEQNIRSHPDCNIFCHSEVEKCEGKKDIPLEYYRYFDPKQDFVKQLYWGNLFSTSAVVCAREILVKAGLFNESLFSAQDYEMWLRMSPMLDPYFIKEILGVYNVRADNITSSSLRRRYQDVTKVLSLHQTKVGPLFYGGRVTKITIDFFRDFVQRQLEQL